MYQYFMQPRWESLMNKTNIILKNNNNMIKSNNKLKH